MYIQQRGVSEWLMVRSWKGRVGATPPWVRIPSPLNLNLKALRSKALKRFYPAKCALYGDGSFGFISKSCYFMRFLQKVSKRQSPQCMVQHCGDFFAYFWQFSRLEIHFQSPIFTSFNSQPILNQFFKQFFQFFLRQLIQTQTFQSF